MFGKVRQEKPLANSHPFCQIACHYSLQLLLAVFFAPPAHRDEKRRVYTSPDDC